MTEYDGDQWIVPASGHKPVALTDGAVHGAEFGVGPCKLYRHDDDENHYFGRGFCQLTWWDNYARTGFMLGRGLEFLLDPDSVDEHEVAYKIMSVGMRTGGGFANGHTFHRYFHGKHTDYVNARRMVNGTSHAREIAGFAQRFEAALLAACSTPSKAVASR